MVKWKTYSLLNSWTCLMSQYPLVVITGSLWKMNIEIIVDLPSYKMLLYSIVMYINHLNPLQHLHDHHYLG